MKLLSGGGLTHREVMALLKSLGYSMRQGRGSGVKYVKEGCPPIVYHVPHGGDRMLKRYILDEIAETVRKGL